MDSCREIHSCVVLHEIYINWETMVIFIPSIFLRDTLLSYAVPPVRRLLHNPSHVVGMGDHGLPGALVLAEDR